MKDRPHKEKPGLEVETELRDGTPVVIRSVRPDDKHLLEIGMEQLSSQDRYFRFFRPMAKLSDKLLHQFTEVDHTNHEAIGALDMGGPKPLPAGVARYIRLEDNPSAAEVAVTVAGSQQGKGLGTLLLAFLAHRAVENEIAELVAMVLSDNHRMIEVFAALGATTKPEVEGQLEVRIPLFANSSLYPATPAGDVFRQAADILAAV